MDNNTKNFAHAAHNRSKWIKVSIFVFVLVFAIVASYYSTSSNNFNVFNIGRTQNLVENNQLTDRFYDEIQQKTYDEILAELNTTETSGQSIIVSPNLQTQESRERVDSITGNIDPENVPVLFTDDGLSNKYVTIRQGDMVTWINKSSAKMSIKGNSWGTFSPRDPEDAYSQRFDFLGIYEYSINEESGTSIKGTVEVVKG